ncbi:MAG: ATPase [Candidatus Auribacter fodinae]|jgi:predicted ATPase|uniref:ATPase n=1 Tax=Candidatus Auribacter fodinae TaxID=2093366 RepID=A0A3A4R593_9BACT|nr:MAG: ATPase [Candidatus Auribacter fodinae]
MKRRDVPCIESLKVTNYRALENLTLKNITPLSVFLGPNGSGKSTLFDVFAFLSECFTTGLRRAWDKRGRFKELRTRNKTGPIEIEIQYREKTDDPLITYHLTIDEDNSNNPVIKEEWLRWKRRSEGAPFKFLDFKLGEGQVISGNYPEKEDDKIKEKLDSPEVLAVNTLGQFAKHPRVSALRRFITSWHLSYFTADATRGRTEAGPQEHLSSTGDNISNVIQYLRERHRDHFDKIITVLTQQVPRLEKIDTELIADGTLLLQIKDAPFDRPILSKFASDGTLKMLAYLMLLYDPNPSQLIGIEEPENHLNPNLLYGIAEECRKATENSQLMVTTHSPFFVDALYPNELWVLYRNEKGYTECKRAADMPRIKEFCDNGASLGDLWRENYFDCGYPLFNQGMPKKEIKRRRQKQ